MIDTHRYLILLTLVLVSIIFSRWHLRDSPIGMLRIIACILVSLIISVIGSRLFAFFMQGHSIASLDWRTLMGSGARHPGSIMALLVVMPLFLAALIPKSWRLQMADTLTMVFLLCMPIHRMVCHMNGCCIGGVCNEGYCMTFPVMSTVYMDQIRAGLIVPGVAQSLPVFPLHAFIGLSAVATFICLFWFNRYKDYAGQLVLLYLVLNEGLKAVLETWRMPYIAELQIASALLGLLGLLGLIVFGFYNYRTKRAM